MTRRETSDKYNILKGVKSQSAPSYGAEEKNDIPLSSSLIRAKITRRRKPRRPRKRRVCSQLSSSTSFAPYPEPKASPHDSIRRGGFRVSRAPHRATAILSSVDCLSFILLVLLTRNDHPRVRGRDRTILR